MNDLLVITRKDCAEWGLAEVEEKFLEQPKILEETEGTDSSEGWEHLVDEKVAVKEIKIDLQEVTLEEWLNFAETFLLDKMFIENITRANSIKTANGIPRSFYSCNDQSENINRLVLVSECGENTGSRQINIFF